MLDNGEERKRVRLEKKGEAENRWNFDDHYLLLKIGHFTEMPFIHLKTGAFDCKTNNH